MSAARIIHPVILCGGSGTRLWPVSRKARPKPFLPLIGDRTLFQQALDRAAHAAQFAEPMVVAGEHHVSLIEEQLGEERAHRLVVEPAARNTAPAIALAAALLDPDDIMLVCPSDHHIADEDAFRDAAAAAGSLAEMGRLVAFGITPDRPETGYGYIRRGQEIAGGFEIADFVEKPDLERAKTYLATGDYSWNGGIFAFRAGTLLDELAAHRPAMAMAVRKSVENGETDGTRFYPSVAEFVAVDGESVDYAVMENTHAAAMVPASMGWSDIGNWAALHDALADGQDGPGNNVAPEDADLVDCKNVLIVSDGPRVSAIDLEDICIVVDGGEVLVTTRDGAQKVGKLPGASQQ
ncbi:MAG: sugar phosphate nucleotidyltransferase [Pseudomonadota bacterium]